MGEAEEAGQYNSNNLSAIQMTSKFQKFNALKRLYKLKNVFQVGLNGIFFLKNHKNCPAAGSFCSQTPMV